MSFFFTKKEVPESARDKAVREFRQAFPNIRKPYHDDSAFEILFQVDQVWYTLKIFLSGDFPISKPTIQVVGAINHPWLDSYKQVVGFEKLSRWNKNSNLVDIINEIIITLQNPTSAQADQQRRSSSQQGAGQEYTNTNTPPAYPAIPNTSTQLFPMQTTPPSYLPPQSQPQARPPSYANAVYQAPTNNYQAPMSNYQQPTSNYQSAYPGSQAQKQPIDLHPALPSISYGSNGYMPAQHPQQTNGYHYPSNNTQQPDSMRPIPSTASSSKKSDNGSSSIGKTSLQRETSSTKIPEIPLRFPELDNLSIPQLERLLADQVAIKAHAASYASVESMKEMLNITRHSNQDRVSVNLRCREQLIMIHDEVEALQHQLIQKLVEYNEMLEMSTKNHFKSPEQILTELQKFRNKLDGETESLGRNFVDSESDITSFLQDYMERRTKFHHISFKLESLR